MDFVFFLRISQDKCNRDYFQLGFLRCFRDPILVPRIGNRISRIRENYHRVPRIRWIGSLQIYAGYVTNSLAKPCFQSNRNRLHLCWNRPMSALLSKFIIRSVRYFSTRRIISVNFAIHFGFHIEFLFDHAVIEL